MQHTFRRFRDNPCKAHMFCMLHIGGGGNANPFETHRMLGTRALARTPKNVIRLGAAAAAHFVVLKLHRMLQIALGEGLKSNARHAKTKAST